MSLKVLIKRDTVANFTTSDYIPQEHELIAAYDTEGRRVIFKIGDGKTPWPGLCEITKISDLGTFSIYTDRSTKPIVEMFLDPFKIREVLSDKSEEARVTYEA